jgi:AcrR family transcriptional regulator
MVAERANCDPALVSYYFGGKAGLEAAVLVEATAELTEIMDAAFSASGTTEERLRAAVAEPIRAFAARPYLAQLIVEQLVLGAKSRREGWLEQFLEPALGPVLELVEEAVKVGEIRPIDPRLLVYTLSALPVSFYLMFPMFRVIYHEDNLGPDAAVQLSTDVIDLILHGGLTESPERPSAPKRKAPATKTRGGGKSRGER